MRRRPLTQRRQPISPYKQILLELLDGRKNANMIYNKLRQTGLRGLAYKQKTLHAIKYLEKAGFVADVSGLKRHRSGKEQPKELTMLGRELSELIYNVDQYYMAFRKLTEAMAQIFAVPYMYPDFYIAHLEIPVNNLQQAVDHQFATPPNAVLRNILRDRGWTSKAIDRSSQAYDLALLLRSIFSPQQIFNIVVMRYSTFYANVKVNETLKRDILNEIITNTILEYVSFMFEEMNKLNSLYRANKIDTQFTIDYTINYFIEKALYSIIGRIHDGRGVDIVYNETEVTDTLASVVSISKPSVEYVDGIVEKIKKRIRSKDEDILDKIMLTAFEQYRQDKNR